MQRARTGLVLGPWLLVTVAALLFVACAPSVQPAPVPESKSALPATAPAAVPQGRWDSLVAAARKEGSVAFYGELSPTLRDMLAKAFKARYGIEIEFVVGKAPEVAQKFMAERRANLHLADALFLGAPMLVLELKPQGVLAPMPPLLAHPDVMDPKAWPGNEVPFLDKDKTALPLSTRYSALVLRNTDMVREDEIKSYQDLLNPAWKGRITMYDPTRSGAASMWANTILKMMGPEEGKKFLQQLARQEPTILTDARLQVEWIARGKNPVGIGPSFGPVMEFQRAGAPLSWVRMAEGGIMTAGAAVYGVPARPAHPNASAVLTNWLLSAEGQAVFSEGWGGPAMRLDVPRTGFDPLMYPRPGDKIYWQDEDFVISQPKAMQLSREIFGHLMK